MISAFNSSPNKHGHISREANAWYIDTCIDTLNDIDIPSHGTKVILYTEACSPHRSSSARGEVSPASSVQ